MIDLAKMKKECSKCDIKLHVLKVKRERMKFKIHDASLSIHEPCDWKFYDNDFQDNGVLKYGKLYYCPNCRDVKFFANDE